jgi:hypothetical protein
VVARAEAEIVTRDGILEDGESGRTAAMFDPFVVARRGDAAGPPVGGVGVRALRPGLGESRRRRVAPEARGQGVMDALGLTARRRGAGERQPEAAALSEASGRERVHEGRADRPVPARHIWFTELRTRAT